MEVAQIKRTLPPMGLGISAAGSRNGGGLAGSFGHQLGEQYKEQFRNRINQLFDELSEHADTILETVNLNKFERFRLLIGELLNEIVKNAYIHNTESVFDRFGKGRVFSSVNLIDQRLQEMAYDLLRQNGENFDFMSRIDEIRGMILDTLL